MTGSDKCDDALPSSSWRSLLADPTSRLDEAGGVLVRLPRGCVCDWGLLGCIPQRCWWENENGGRPSQAGMQGSVFRVSVAEGQASSSVAEISCSSLVPTDSAGQECGHAKWDSSWSLSYVVSGLRWQHSKAGWPTEQGLGPSRSCLTCKYG